MGLFEKFGPIFFYLDLPEAAPCLGYRVRCHPVRTMTPSVGSIVPEFYGNSQVLEGAVIFDIINKDSLTATAMSTINLTLSAELDRRLRIEATKQGVEPDRYILNI